MNKDILLVPLSLLGHGSYSTCPQSQEPCKGFCSQGPLIDREAAVGNDDTL